MRAAWLICGLVIAAVTAAADPTPPVELTAEQDHKLMMDKLGLAAIRQGANGRDPPRLTTPTTTNRRPIHTRRCRIR
jgi:hypothetical protein